MEMDTSIASAFETYPLDQLPALLDDVINGIEDPLLLLTLEGNICAANIAALELLGYLPKEIQGCNLEAILADKVLALLVSQGLLRDGSLVNFHLPMKSKQGEEIPVSLDSRLLYGHNDQAVGILLMAKDLRRGDRLHHKLVQSAKMAVMGQMATGIAHELNNPLTGVLGLTELLLEYPKLPEECREDLQLLHAHASRCKIVVERLLSLARAHEELRWEATSVNEIVKRALNLAGNELRLCRVKVFEELDPHLDECWTDPDHLIQVFLNLIINAARAMPDGGTLTVKSYTDGDRLAVSFKDTGTGIPPEELDRIFEPFYTTSSGLGLGLSLSQTIVRALGGDIKASSQPGHGATFIVDLPRLIPELEGVTWQCLKSLRDRRTSPRLPKREQLTLESATVSGTLWTCDISPGGIRVETPQPLALHKEYKVTLNLEGKDIIVKGKVVWQEPREDATSYEAGLMFTEVGYDNAAAISRYIAKHTGKMFTDQGRRKRLRLPRLRYVRFRHPKRELPGIGSGVLLDLTPQGAKMLTSIELKKDTEVMIWLDFGQVNPVIDLPAIVRWTRTLESYPGQIRERYLSGLQFNSDDPRLEHFFQDFLTRRTQVRLTDISGGLKTLLTRDK